MSSGGWVGSTRRSALPAEWDAIRRAVLDRDGHTCTNCGAPANQVDHVIRGDTILTSLCTPCHAAKSSTEGHEAARAARAKARRAQRRHPGLT
jgi:5-methylcytosine-specific restriction enzyme A